MLMTRIVVWMFSVSMMILAAGRASGQDYPNKPIILLAAQAGGGNDQMARLIAQGISGPLGQPIIVENRTGIVSVTTAARAAPDGYTLLLYSNGLWTLPLMRSDVSYDPIKDFSPITLVSSTPNILVITASLPVTSVSELIALAKAKPGTLNYASSGPGTSTHLAGALLASIAGVNIVHVPYKSAPPVLTALLSGEVQLALMTALSVAPHVKSGKLRALGVTTAQPSPLAPGLPPVAATVPGYESVTIFGLFAPARTPATIVNRLNHEVVRMLNRPDIKDAILRTGSEAIGSSPAEFTAMMRSEIGQLGKVIKGGGIHSE